MSSFVTIFIVSTFMLDLSIQREVTILSSSLLEKLQSFESSEFIQIPIIRINIADGDEKQSYILSPKNIRGVNTLRRKLIRSAPELTKGMNIITTANKGRFSSSPVSFDAGEDSSEEMPTREANGRTALQRNRFHINQFFKNPHTLYHEEAKVSSYSTEKESTKSRVLDSVIDYRSSELSNTVTQNETGVNNANKINSLHKYSSTLQPNGGVLEETSHNSTNRDVTSKGSDFSNLSYPILTNYYIASSSLNVFNTSEALMNNISTANMYASSTVGPNSMPKLKLSKTAVAAIVSGINGLIGFAGAAIFTCMKFRNLKNDEERKPLIR